MRSFRRLLAGVALAATPLAGAAASMPSIDADAPPPRLAGWERPAETAKGTAILGGQASSLSAILQEQKAAMAAPVALGTPITPAARRGGYAIPAHRAVVRAHASRPDIFGTVALSVGRTPFDARWNRVANAPVHGRAASFAQGLRGQDEKTAIQAINRYVNGRVGFVEDRDQYGIADRWVRASDTLERGRGDCEDYAIAKMAMLRAAGFDAGDLYLVVLKDLARRADHAVLVVRSEGRFLVLDNNTNRVADANAINFFRPILTYSAAGAWTHGYERRQPAFTVAAAEVDMTPVALNAALPQPSAFLR